MFRRGILKAEFVGTEKDCRGDNKGVLRFAQDDRAFTASTSEALQSTFLRMEGRACRDRSIPLNHV